MTFLNTLIENHLWNLMLSLGVLTFGLFIYHYRIMGPTIFCVQMLSDGVKDLIGEIKIIRDDHDNSNQRIARIEGRISKK